METLLRKYLWAIDLLVIALCAVFSARATATVIESYLVRVTPAVKAAPRATTASSNATVYTKQLEEILNRNVFCSGCPPILKKEVKEDGPPPPTAPQKSTLPLRLLAVMFAPGDARWSMAIIRDNDDKTAGPYAVGSKIRTAVVDHIDETRVYLDVSGRKEYLDLVDQPQAANQPQAAISPSVPTPPSGDPLMAELDKGIKKTSEHKYEVQRGTVDSLLGNMSVLSRSARIVPEVKDGKAAGFRLFSVRPDGPFAKIGLQNGDVISAINGLEMTSPDKALEVYTKLRSASHLSVGLERNGQKITKEYNIR